ncbi:MAG: hypothetical protein IJT23_02750 [Clostridia bacterium]|nr:hypothetical protein [Clostridia bacterium]
MKKIISLLITLFIISETAFAFTQDDLSRCRYNVYKQYEDLFTSNAYMLNGEPILDYLDTTKVFRIIYLKENNSAGFKFYKEGNFSDLLRKNGSIIFTGKLKDTDRNIVINRHYSMAHGAWILEENGMKFDNNVGLNDDDTLVKLLDAEGVTDVTDFVQSVVGTNYSHRFLYMNTDKGEYIMLEKDFDSGVASQEVLKANILYPANVFVDYCKAAKIKDIQEIWAEGDNEPYTTIIDGEAVYITPKPTATSVVTAEPEATPKPVIDITPKPTVTPDVTTRPTVEPTAVSTEKPQTDKTLTVRTRGRITITIDTDEVQFPDAQPFVDENDRTQAPIRTVAEMLNSTVLWDNETRTVTITNKNGDVITIIIDSPVMSVNGKAVYMDTQATIRDNRTYIPVRFIAEAMNMSVKWSD